MFPVLLGEYLGVELLYPVISVLLIFLMNRQTAFHSGCNSSILTSMDEASSFFTSLVNTWYCHLFGLSSPSGYKVESHCGLGCISLVPSYVEQLNIFSRAYWSLLTIVSSLEECILKSFSHFKIELFVFLLFSCKRLFFGMCIFWI